MDGSSDGPSCDASPRIIQASSYDQTCTVDTDCAGITEGNSCNPCSLNCINAAINILALPQYTSDNGNLVSSAETLCPSSCGGPESTCCRGGTCQWGYPSCPYPSESVCAPSACTGTCANLSAHNVSMMVNGCLVWQCCVLDDDAGEDGAVTDAGPIEAGGDASHE